MARRVRFPIRVKVLLTALSVIMLVVTLITATMANLFHEDKTAYMRDLTSVMAMHIAREADGVVRNYADSLGLFADVIFERQIMAEQKQKLVEELFANFADFIAVSAHRDGVEPVTIYDAQALEAVGLSADALREFRERHPLPLASILSGEVFVANATFSQALPLLAVAVPRTDESTGETAVVAAFVRLDRLLDLTRRSATFSAVIVDAGGTVVAHADLAQVVARAPATWLPEVAAVAEGAHALGTTAEYEHDGQDYIGGFAAARVGGMLASVQIPKAVAYLTSRALLRNLVTLALGLFAVAAVLALLLSRRLTRPIERLTSAAQAVGKGDFNVAVETRSSDEIGVLSESFNDMTTELKEREDALGQAHAALVQSEKMAAFGQLGAGIAHEVKNPLAGIQGYAQLALRKTAADSPIRKHLQVIEKETKRCTEIIGNLMRFARQEETHMGNVQLNRVVEEALAIVDHQLGINGVKLQTDLAADLPLVLGNANQLQQIILNFAINAQQAMAGEPGTVRIETEEGADGTVELRVTDDGPGMPEEVRAKIFEPFFTTKPAGEGTGLGLAVTYGIVRDHEGELQCASTVGEGTTFTVRLPARALSEVEAEEAAA